VGSRFAGIRFAAIGHVTNDRLAAGHAPGGSALYGALTAAHLGARARAVTAAAPDFVGAALLATAGVTLEVRPSPQTTSFENRYDDRGERRARVLALAAPLLDPVLDADVVLACPVAGEVAASALVRPPGGILAAGLQGWLRRIGPDGEVGRTLDLDAAVFAACDALFVSVEDLGPGAPRLVPVLAGAAPILVVTDGARGARLWVAGAAHRVPACPAVEIDPTGAGDVFAAAFLLALRAGEAPLAAAGFAACAASIVVEGVGPDPLPRLAGPELAARLASHRETITF
jgi:1D-myo-inositol 3-kinase